MSNTYSLDLELSSTQFASVADHADFQFGTGDFTVMCWLKRESINSDFAIISKCNGTTASGWILRTNTQNNFRFDCINSTIDTTLTTPSYTSTSAWYHVAVTRSGTNITIFVNGVSAGTGTSAKNITSSGNALIVGKGVEDSTYYWDGLIDEVRIYKGRALTGAEILKIYKRESIDASLKGFWKLNNSYTDSSGNSHTLTASGSPVFSSTVPFSEYESDAGFLMNFT